MRPLVREELVPLDAYGALRDDYRRAVIAHKRLRRVAVGENVTLLFEDRETLRFQVQEMLWVERISEPRKVQHELDVYNELMPGPDELSATLFVEIGDLAEIRAVLDRLIGIDEHVALVLGGDDDELAVPARFDPKQMEEDRISAVQYIRFALGAEAARRLRDSAVPARVRIAHPAYRRECELAPPVRESLARGLAEEPPRLLPEAPAAGAGDADDDEVLFTAPGARAVRPRDADGPGHVVVEPVPPRASLLEAPPEALAALFRAVQRAAEDVTARHGGCRVRVDVPDASGRLRVHVTPR